MLASVIIPTIGDPVRLEWTLESMARQSDQNFQLIVINDGGRRRSSRLVEKYRSFFGDRLVYEYMEKSNKTFTAAAARNRGVRLSSGDVLIFLDEDCAAFPEMVYEHCRLHAWNHVTQGIRLRLPLARVRKVEKDFSYRWLLDNADMEGMSESMTLGNLFSFNFSMDAKSFCRIGGFDEDYIGWGGEDLDLGHRLMKMGFSRSLVNVEGSVIHLDHDKRDDTSSWRDIFQSKLNGPVERNGGRLVRVNA